MDYIQYTPLHNDTNQWIIKSFDQTSVKPKISRVRFNERDIVDLTDSPLKSSGKFAI